MTLLQECMEVLKINIYILSEDEQKNIKSIEKLSEINNDEELYIIWSYPDLPIIKSNAMLFLAI